MSGGNVDFILPQHNLELLPWDKLSLPLKQFRFAQYVSSLWGQAWEMGYMVVPGSYWRSADEAKANAERGTGIENSNHRLCLAVDINLFEWDYFNEKWVWCQKTDDYRPLGEWWVGLGQAMDVPLCWGGNWTKPDAFHFSVRHNGVE